MKHELCLDFSVPASKVSVIPFGINNTLPNTDLTSAAAKRRLGLGIDEPTALFFGQIAPYKGLEYLVEALPAILNEQKKFRLIVAGKVRRKPGARRDVERRLLRLNCSDRVGLRIEHVSDEEAELYLKGADVLVLPYTDIFQSGLPFLGYRSVYPSSRPMWALCGRMLLRASLA